MRKQIRSGLLFTILVGFATGCAFFNANYAEVVPGELYRSGQVHEDAFRRHLEETGVQTVISLRGGSPEKSWYLDELAITRELGVAYHSLGWSKDRLLTPGELREYLELMEASPKPIWVHCQGGVHRATMASIIYRLTQGDDLESAREEIVLGFGDPAIGKLLDLYEGHNKAFVQWAVEDYPQLYEDAQAGRGAD